MCTGLWGTRLNVPTRLFHVNTCYVRAYCNLNGEQEAAAQELTVKQREAGNEEED